MKTKRYQVIFDISNFSRTKDKTLIENLLVSISKLINMKIIAGPVVADSIDDKNPGLSGFVIIDYSHISIHTFSKHREILIDVFSCKEYAREVVFNFMRKTLAVRNQDISFKIVSWG